MSEYRHEYKYICSEQQLALIQNNIQGLMECDAHAGEDNQYRIRSLYFDDYCDNCMKDNLNGNDPREKFRIRIYDQKSSYIRLELKRKERGKTKKTSCVIDESLCRRILAGQPLAMDAVDAPVYRKFCLWQQVRLLMPKVIVEYDRVPYLYRDGNVRVTLDRHISSSGMVEQFLDTDIVTRPVMPLGQHVLEVKFDDFLPDAVYQILKTAMVDRCAISKYVMCRNMNRRIRFR